MLFTTPQMNGNKKINPGIIPRDNYLRKISPTFIY